MGKPALILSHNYNVLQKHLGPHEDGFGRLAFSPTNLPMLKAAHILFII